MSFLYTDATKPWKVDAPSIEGFGCVMLASLSRTRASIADIYTKGRTRTAPVVAAPFADILPLLYQDPVPADVDALAGRIAAYLISVQKGGLFVPLLHSMGWSYGVKGKLVDPKGQPVVGARVRSVDDDGIRVWEGMATPEPSGTDGSFTIPYGVFGVRSALRVYTAADSQDVEVLIPLTTPTNEIVDRGTITLKAEQRQVSLSMSKDLVMTPGTRAQNPLKVHLSGDWRGAKNTLVTPPQQGSTYIDLQMTSPLFQASQITAEVEYALTHGNEWTTSLSPGDYGTATKAVTKFAPPRLEVREALGPRDTLTKSTQTPPSLTLNLPAAATDGEYYRADVALSWDYTQTYYDGSGQQVGSQSGTASILVLHVYRGVSSSL